MNDDMSDLERLLWMERRFGLLQKTVGGSPTNEEFESIGNQLNSYLSTYKTKLGIGIPVPRVRMWFAQNKINFLFFDKRSGKRIFLADWLANKETYYEH